MSNWDLKKDEEEFDINEVIQKTRYILKKLTAKDFVIILLILMMFLIYVVHTRDIEACNFYCQELLKNSTRLTTPIW